MPQALAYVVASLKPATLSRSLAHFHSATGIIFSGCFSPLYSAVEEESCVHLEQI